MPNFLRRTLYPSVNSSGGGDDGQRGGANERSSITYYNRTMPPPPPPAAAVAAAVLYNAWTLIKMLGWTYQGSYNLPTLPGRGSLCIGQFP